MSENTPAPGLSAPAVGRQYPAPSLPSIGVTLYEYFSFHQKLYWGNLLLRYNDGEFNGFFVLVRLPQPKGQPALGFLIQLDEDFRRFEPWSEPIALRSDHCLTKEDVLLLIGPRDAYNTLHDWEALVYDEWVQVRQGNPLVNPYPR